MTDQIVAAGAYFIVWRPDGTVQTRSANAPGDLSVPPHQPGAEAHAVRTRGAMREFVRFNKPDRCFLVGRSITAELAGAAR